MIIIVIPVSIVYIEGFFYIPLVICHSNCLRFQPSFLPDIQSKHHPSSYPQSQLDRSIFQEQGEQMIESSSPKLIPGMTSNSTLAYLRLITLVLKNLQESYKKGVTPFPGTTTSMCGNQSDASRSFGVLTLCFWNKHASWSSSTSVAAWSVAKTSFQEPCTRRMLERINRFKVSECSRRKWQKRSHSMNVFDRLT